MIFLDIQRDVWTRLNKPNPPDPQTQARVKSFINQRHRTLLTMPGLDQLRQDTIQIDSIANVSFIPLPMMVNRIDAMVDQINNRGLREKPLSWLRTIDPRYSSGTPTHYVARGYQHEIYRQEQPGELWAASQSPLETSVIRADGVALEVPPLPTWVPFPTSASVTLQGGTLVRLGTESHWSQITKVFLSAPAIGRVVVHLAQPGVPGPVIMSTVAVIEPGNVRSYNFLLHLWPKPTAIRPYLIDYTRTLTDLVEDTDEPLLPEDFHDLLAIGARQDEYEKTDDQRFKTAVAEWNERYKALQYFLQGRQSKRIIPYGMKGGRTGWNNVNSWAAPDFYL